MSLAAQIKNAITEAFASLKQDKPAPAPAAPAAAAPAPAAAAAPDPKGNHGSHSEPSSAELATAIAAAIKAEIAPLQTALTEANNKVVKLEGEKTQLENTIKNPAGQIETISSLKASEIAAAQGAKPLTAAPVEKPAAAQPAASGLKGRARLTAAIETQLNANFPVAAAR